MPGAILADSMVNSGVQPLFEDGHLYSMRYLVRARVKDGCRATLLEAIERGTLGEGSVAEGEYLRNMNEARVCADQTVGWVEVCYCPTPLQEERPYWEEYFELVKVQEAHDRRRCQDENGSEPWASCTFTSSKYSSQ